MSILFSETIIKNENSIEVEVTIEAPAGTSVTTEKVGPNATKNIAINKQDIQTAKISVKAGEYHGADTMSLDFSSSGKPYEVYIEKIDAVTVIGSIHGNATVKF